jgi:hypothetical protein
MGKMVFMNRVSLLVGDGRGRRFRALCSGRARVSPCRAKKECRVENKPAGNANVSVEKLPSFFV